MMRCRQRPLTYVLIVVLVRFVICLFVRFCNLGDIVFLAMNYTATLNLVRPASFIIRGCVVHRLFLVCG